MHTGAIPISFGSFGRAKIDPIHFSNVQCSGTENVLMACWHSSQHMCSHGEDAGVICKSESEYMYTVGIALVSFHYYFIHTNLCFIIIIVKNHSIKCTNSLGISCDCSCSRVQKWRCTVGQFIWSSFPARTCRNLLRSKVEQCV